ncbi:MAG TPA: helix-turn-helix transcriptional regulator [Gemmatimonadaceae bacterium]|nr:helix-turn-helix transcriptional regulator [Gemmatimonadaceae bacterium]
MRIRLPEVLTEHKITAYEVAKRSDGRVIPSTLYRLVRQRGRVRMFDGALLETLCEILNVEPGVLLERRRRKGGGGRSG